MKTSSKQTARTTVRALITAVLSCVLISSPVFGGTPVLPTAPLAFMSTQDDPGFDIYTINPDGTGLVNISRDPGVISLEPNWSWNGGLLTWYGGPGGQADIYVANANGSSIRTITPDYADNVTPCFSPDGLWIAYTVVGGELLRIVPVAGGTPQEIGTGSWPDFSPDGTKILTTAWASRTVGELYVLDLLTGQNHLIAASPGYVDMRATWSPDGTKIAFESDRRGTSDIWTMNADGTGLFCLTESWTTSHESSPTWSPDGNFIAFSSSRSGNGDIYIVRANGQRLSDGSEWFQVTSGPAIELEPSWPKGMAADLDSDGDGVPNSTDQCPNTLPGAIVDAQGCSIGQLAPCEGPVSGGAWRNHGQYVGSVARIAMQFLQAGLISESQAEVITSEAARMDCGKR